MKLLEHCYVINLKERSDRLEKVMNDFKKIDLNVNVWEGMPHEEISDDEIKSLPKKYKRNKKSTIACFRSHRNLIEHAYNMGYKNIAIFEDDAELFDPINFKTEYFKSISGLPENWMFLFLGCKVYNTEKYSDGLQLVLRASLAHAYILNSYIYEYVLALLETETFPIDTLFNTLHAARKSFCVQPFLFGQRSDYSNITNTIMPNRVPYRIVEETGKRLNKIRRMRINKQRALEKQREIKRINEQRINEQKELEKQKAIKKMKKVLYIKDKGKSIIYNNQLINTPTKIVLGNNFRKLKLSMKFAGIIDYEILKE